MEHRHTETLLTEICKRERYGSIIVKYDKTVALYMLNMIKPYLSV